LESRRERGEGVLRGGSKGVLVLGKKTKKAKDLERLLMKHPCRVKIASNPIDAFNQNRGEDIDFIIMTESLNYKIDEDLLSRLRVLYPKAKLLLLVDHITREMEVGMRSKGLVFLGSYRRFVQFHREIIGLTAKHGKSLGPQ
jgi:hypothetical protein